MSALEFKVHRKIEHFINLLLLMSLQNSMAFCGTQNKDLNKDLNKVRVQTTLDSIGLQCMDKDAHV